MSITKELARIQQELKAPKGQFNSFGKYKYRSCEDIVEAVKPLLGDCVLLVGDEIVEVGGRIYVKATAALHSDKQHIETCGWAREPETKKGMDVSQITGAASSYARKYALNGLFAIDDTKDADATSNHGTAPQKAAYKTSQADKEQVKIIQVAHQNGDVDSLRDELKGLSGDRKAYVWSQLGEEVQTWIKEAMGAGK